MRSAAGLAVTLALVAAAAHAQTNDEVMTGTQLDFSTPGARSLGLGGAFLAVADDATAAFTNPSGLTQLTAPEVSLEGRVWGFTSRFTERGHLPETNLTGIGIDVVDGLEAGEIEEDSAALSFLSAAWTGRRWAVAAYRHQLAEFRAALDTQGAFVGPRVAPLRLAPARSRLRLEIANFGVAGAWRVSERWAIGLGLSRFDFALDSRTLRYARAERSGDPFADTLTGAFFGPADFRDTNLANLQLQRGDDSDLEWSLGALWRPTARWSVGASARRGPDFDFTATFVDGPRGSRPGEVDPALSGPARFHVPDGWGLGIAWRPFESSVIALDWVRIEYSDLTADLRNVLRAAVGDERNFHAADADEFHLGAEHQFLGSRWPVALRGGVWFDPEHRIRYLGRDPTLRARFRPGEDQVHYALGGGVVVGRTQVDLAADLADTVETLSLSAVARF